ncbi:uncharacterized protein LOC111716362 isoform X2 [Eurytemora carolleeae]|uniref:uncharacterized protein LOC111716362 isoform X2 n=1 Tax=Eurytemora carolleeae TaxID=1294199 RepID=UPI000C759A55|nr:uncharacterized protein LOC111716362 isoform X2 [Eurytemora carolleeae]|eukprot:XP_023347575.1 uncharacterized protein LOC111716362 isoform X2 [Eurytemora affinis]
MHYRMYLRKNTVTKFPCQVTCFCGVNSRREVYENLSSLMVPSIYVGEESNDTTISVRLKKDKFLSERFTEMCSCGRRADGKRIEETGEITFIRIDRINMLTNTKSQALIDLNPAFNILSCLLHLRKKFKYCLTFILLE